MKSILRTLFTSLLFAILFFSFYKGLGHLFFEKRLLDIRKNHFLGLSKAIQSAPDFSTAARNIQLNYDQIAGTTTIFWIIQNSGEVIFSSTEKPIDDELIRSHATDLKNMHNNDVLEFRSKYSAEDSIFVFVKLPDQSNQILVVYSTRSGFFSKLNSWVLLLILLTSSGIWIIANLILSLYIRNKNTAIEKILSHFEKGNLNQRLHRNWFDKLLGLFRDFNLMSEKLEKTFIKNQQIEFEKKQLIQELTHDLRTPLTSLKTASEALLNSSIHADARDTLLKVILNETDYLNILIEDLFFISEIPSVIQNHSSFFIKDLLEDEVARYTASNSSLNFKINQNSTYLKIIHNELLFRRLISNIIKNSVQVGSKNMSILFENTNTYLNLTFIDDGPGMSLEQIAQYGQKNKVRSFDKKDFKGSLGLGSVIIHRIISALNGELIVSNNTNSSGLCIQIKVPVNCQ